jgi:DUF1680 family protein
MCVFAMKLWGAEAPATPGARSPGVLAGARGVANTPASPHVKFHNVDMDSVRWTEGFWAERFELCREATIPALFEVMHRPDNSANFQNLRIPGWAQGATIQVGGQDAAGDVEPLSYARLQRRWSPGDTIQLDLPMEVVLVEAHPLVEETRDHVAVMRGPIVYCLESVDLPEGVAIDDYRLPRQPQWRVRRDASLLRAVAVLQTEGLAVPQQRTSKSLYRPLPAGPTKRIPLHLIPYYAWCNRGEGDMTVWIPVE